MKLRGPAPSGCGASQLLLVCMVSIWMLFPVVVADTRSWPHHQSFSRDLYGLHHHQHSKQGLHQYHPLKTPLKSLQLWGPKSPVHHEAEKNSNGVVYSPRIRYEKQHTKQGEELKEDSVSEPYYHHERSMVRSRSVANMKYGFEEIIHSFVIEGKFGVAIDEQINKTSEYLFEFIYNATELKVCGFCINVW